LYQGTTLSRALSGSESIRGQAFALQANPL
jgi:hypothetical protein